MRGTEESHQVKIVESSNEQVGVLNTFNLGSVQVWVATSGTFPVNKKTYMVEFQAMFIKNTSL